MLNKFSGNLMRSAVELALIWREDKAARNLEATLIVADKNQRGELRSERMDQADFSNPATVKKFGKETGADFMLKGQINTITDSAKSTTLKYYQVELELIDI